MTSGKLDEELARMSEIGDTIRSGGLRLLPDEPLPTGYGEDSYRRIFGLAAETTPAAATAEGS